MQENLRWAAECRKAHMRLSSRSNTRQDKTALHLVLYQSLEGLKHLYSRPTGLGDLVVALPRRRQQKMHRTTKPRKTARTATGIIMSTHTRRSQSSAHAAFSSDTNKRTGTYAVPVLQRCGECGMIMHFVGFWWDFN